MVKEEQGDLFLSSLFHRPTFAEKLEGERKHPVLLLLLLLENQRVVLLLFLLLLLLSSVHQTQMWEWKKKKKKKWEEEKCREEVWAWHGCDAVEASELLLGHRNWPRWLMMD